MQFCIFWLFYRVAGAEQRYLIESQPYGIDYFQFRMKLVGIDYFHILITVRLWMQYHIFWLFYSQKNHEELHVGFSGNAIIVSARSTVWTSVLIWQMCLISITKNQYISSAIARWQVYCYILFHLISIFVQDTLLHRDCICSDHSKTVSLVRKAVHHMFTPTPVGWATIPSNNSK